MHTYVHRVPYIGKALREKNFAVSAVLSKVFTIKYIACFQARAYKDCKSFHTFVLGLNFSRTLYIKYFVPHVAPSAVATLSH